MNILFLDAYFKPESIAYTHLEDDLLEGLMLRGHLIQVICPIPTRGVSKETKEEYRKRKTEILHGGKLKIQRFWAPNERKHPIVRAFRYLWCNFRTYQLAKRIKGIDVVFSNSTPPTQGALAAIVAKNLSKTYKRKVPFIYNLQDIFPDSLISTKLSSAGSILWRIGRRMEDFIYSEASEIIVISEGFKKNIRKKGVPEKKISVISNWIDLHTVKPIKREDNTLIQEFNIDPQKFLVVYAGNWGATQGADIILDAAKELAYNQDIMFVLFGGGVYFQDAKNQSAKLKNVFMHELLPANRISEVYSLGDVSLITCKPGTGGAGLPSKTWSIMACNSRIIASFDTDSDLAELIKQSGAGKCVEPNNKTLLVEEIVNAYKGHQKVLTREYILKYASKEACVAKFVECFERVEKNE